MVRQPKIYGEAKNSSQLSRKERTQKLLQEKKEKEEEKINSALLTEERIQTKLSELEGQKNELDKEKNNLEESYKTKEKELESSFETRKKALEDEYSKKFEELDNGYKNKNNTLEKEYLLKKQELDDSIKLQKEINDELENQKASLKKQESEGNRRINEAIENEILRIKNSEAAIREDEKNRLYSEWEKDLFKKRNDFSAYLDEQHKLIDTEYSKAVEERTNSQKLGIDKINDLRIFFENKMDELSKDYESKVKELTLEKAKLDSRLKEIAEKETEIAEQITYLKSLREKYNSYNENAVENLIMEKEHFKTQADIYMARIKELDAQNAKLSSELAMGNGVALIEKNKALEARIGILEEEKNNSLILTHEEYNELISYKDLLITKSQQLEDEKLKVSRLNNKLASTTISASELENAKNQADALLALNRQLQEKLKFISDQYKTTQENKFSVLLDIDRKLENEKIAFFSNRITNLNELCKYVRNYGAKYEKLYYSIETISAFFASMAASEPKSRLLILQGLSGTGKSSLPNLVGKAIGAVCDVISVQPSWRDNRELLGYDNDFTNKFKATDFTKCIYRASARINRNKIYLIVLDEVNLARIEYYFADFLSSLEKPDKDDWLIPLIPNYVENDESCKPKYLNYDNNGANLIITPNIWFVGTANNDDSTSTITDKVYDRAQVLDMDSREEAFDGGNVSSTSIDFDSLIEMFKYAKESSKNNLTTEDLDNINLIDLELKKMDVSFGNRMLDQMKIFVPVYCACSNRPKEEAIDYFLTHKILRKLDERYESNLTKKFEDLKKTIQEVYPNYVFKQCNDKLDKLTDKIKG